MSVSECKLLNFELFSLGPLKYFLFKIIVNFTALYLEKL